MLVIAGVMFLTSHSADAAGGEGATSCERSFSILGVGWSQSVECEEGYHAKCGVFSAKCIENAVE